MRRHVLREYRTATRYWRATWRGIITRREADGLILQVQRRQAREANR